MSSKCENFESEEALKIAKTNVEKYYAVVGILERWQESLQLLEVQPCSFIKSILVRTKLEYNNLKQLF